MAGLGEARRDYHRRAVAERLRELRRLRGWTQEKLAEELRIDRRQVVRLESRRAPVTLEVVEALANVFGEVSLVFMWSAMNNKQGTRDLDRELVVRLAEQEALSAMNANLNRPLLTWILATATTLPDEDLDLLAQIALVIFRARAVTDSDPGDYTPLQPRLTKERGLQALSPQIR